MSATTAALRRPSAGADVRDAVWRGVVGVTVAVLLWQLVTRLDDWVGVAVPLVAPLPPPSEVFADFAELAGSGGYWNSWSLSMQRVGLGFARRSSSGVAWVC